MLSKKSVFSTFITMMIVFVLSACGGDNEPSQEVGGTGEEATPLSKALVKEKIWISTPHNELDRDRAVHRIYHFEEDTVSYYDLIRSAEDEESFKVELKMEEIAGMTDEEILSFAQDNGIEEDLGTYTLDILLDDHGNNTENIMLLPNEGMINDTVIFHPISFRETIFDAEFVGFEAENIHYGMSEGYDNGLIFTPVDNPSTYFALDNMDGKNVTIEERSEFLEKKREEKEALEREREQEEENNVTIDSDVEDIYRNSCISCHGDDLSGGSGPDLTKVGSKYSDQEILDIIMGGTGTMPGGLVNDEEAERLTLWLRELK